MLEQTPPTRMSLRRAPFPASDLASGLDCPPFLLSLPQTSSYLQRHETNERSLHESPTPRLADISLSVSLCVGLARRWRLLGARSSVCAPCMRPPTSVRPHVRPSEERAGCPSVRPFICPPKLDGRTDGTTTASARETFNPGTPSANIQSERCIRSREIRQKHIYTSIEQELLFCEMKRTLPEA